LLRASPTRRNGMQKKFSVPGGYRAIFDTLIWAFVTMRSAL
jgi:hypothetical protein